MYLRNETNNTFKKLFAVCAVALIGLCAAVSTARADTTFTAVLSGLSEIPMNGSTAVGRGSVVLNTAETQITYKLEFSGLSSNQTDAHIHAPAERDANAGVLFSIGSTGMTSGSLTGTVAVTPEQAAQLKVGLWYFNVHSTTFPGGEIRGQIIGLCAPESINLVSWYRAESSTLDEKGANNAAFVGTMDYPSGRVGKAFGLDGTNYVRVADSATLDVTREITLAAWIRAEDLSGSRRIIDKTKFGLSDAYSLDLLSGKPRFIGTGEAYIGTATVQPNVWTHVAATYDGAKVRFYINGIQDSAFVESDALTANNEPLRIGADTNGLNRFKGAIDEAMIYNRALTAEEINQQASAGASGLCTTGAVFPSSDGSLDLTFDADGIITTPVGSESAANAVAIQTDGKIVAVGSSAEFGINYDFAVARYNADGTLDTSFDTDGIVTTPVSAADYANAAVIQTDGKIVAVGYAYHGGVANYALVRYNTNGSLDTSYGTGGIVYPNSPITTIVWAAAIQGNGKIVIAGYSGSSTSAFYVARFNTDGSLDASFGSGGSVTTPIRGNDIPYAVAIQTDGKIVVAGNSRVGLSGNLECAVVRYNTDGSLDTSFSADGIVSNSFSPSSEPSSEGFAYGLAIQANGKIVVAGQSRYLSSAQIDFAVARYNTDGSLDSSFSGDGLVTTPVGSSGGGLSGSARAVVIQADGKIVSVGSSLNDSTLFFSVVRYNPDGSLDTSFSGDGIVTTPIGSFNSSAYAAAIQTDGKIVVAGSNIDGFVIVRYGTSDCTFALNATTAICFDNINRLGASVATPLNAEIVPKAPDGTNFISGTLQEIRTSVAFAPGALVRFTLPMSMTESQFNAAQVLHFENGAWVDRTTAAPPRDYAARTIYGRVNSFSPFAVVAPLSPTAAQVSVGGRVTTSDGRGIRRALVTITDANGNSRTILTGKFGAYWFTDVAAGETYIIAVRARRFTFASPTQVRTVIEDLTDVDFAANEQSSITFD